jgi:hypothetical protein
VSSLAQKNASTDAKLNLCSTSEEKPFMATAEVSLNPVNDLDEQTKGTMKAQVYHGHGKVAWEEKPRPRHPASGRCHCAAYRLDDLSTFVSC